MQTLLTVFLIWITPSLLFVGWRLWVTRPRRGIRHRQWEHTAPLTFVPPSRTWGP